VKISCNEDVYICHTSFTKKMERNSHGTTSQWNTYRKQLFSKDLEVQDVIIESHSQTATYCLVDTFYTNQKGLALGFALICWRRWRSLPSSTYIHKLTFCRISTTFFSQGLFTLVTKGRDK
jgi:hypothetical protein